MPTRSRPRREKIATAIGRRIRSARSRAGLTQAQLAEIAHVEVVQVSRIERGAVLARVETLIAIAQALQVRVDTILGTDIPPVPMADERLLELAHQLGPEDRQVLDAVLVALAARSAR